MYKVTAVRIAIDTRAWSTGNVKPNCSVAHRPSFQASVVPHRFSALPLTIRTEPRLVGARTFTPAATDTVTDTCPSCLVEPKRSQDLAWESAAFD